MNLLISINLAQTNLSKEINMAAYDENGNMIQDTQSEEIIIDTNNNFADYEYDDNTDIIIE